MVPESFDSLKACSPLNNTNMIAIMKDDNCEHDWGSILATNEEGDFSSQKEVEQLDEEVVSKTPPLNQGRTHGESYVTFETEQRLVFT